MLAGLNSAWFWPSWVPIMLSYIFITPQVSDAHGHPWLGRDSTKNMCPTRLHLPGCCLKWLLCKGSTAQCGVD
jgi:hypothetical protein